MIDNQFDNILSDMDVNIMQHVRNPLDIPKVELPQWIFATRKEGCRIRTATSYDKVHALILDYDHDITIDEWERDNSEYAYVLHTSSGHSKNTNKFKCIIPIKDPIEYSVLNTKCVLDAFMIKFPNIDMSSNRNTQKLPSFPNIKTDYYYSTNTGKKFSMEDILPILEDMALDAQFEASMHPPVVYLPREGMVFDMESYIDNWVISRLDQYSWFSDGTGRHSAMESLCGTWKRKCKFEGVDPSPIVRAIHNYRMPEKYKKMARQMIR